MLAKMIMQLLIIILVMGLAVFVEGASLPRWAR